MTVSMILEDISQLPKMQRILGLDLGEKTIGVALSDILQTIASPVEIIKRKKYTIDVERVFALIDQHKVDTVVIGLPVNMDGTEGPRCQSVRQFGRNMLKTSPEVQIYYQDERMSSQAVARTMDMAAMTHTRQKELVDKLAASYILQGALDRARIANSHA